MSKATLNSFLDPENTHSLNTFTFSAQLVGEGKRVFVMLTPWVSLRLDDFIDGIPLALALYESLRGSCPEMTTAKREYIKYCQRALFDGNLLGACVDPWALLVPTVTKGKRIRHHAYFQGRLDAAVRLLKLHLAHLEAHHVTATAAQKKARVCPQLFKEAWDYVRTKNNGWCEFREHMERACVDVRGEVRRILLEGLFGVDFLDLYRLRKELCLSGVGFSHVGHSHPFPYKRRENLGWLLLTVPKTGTPPSIWPETVPKKFYAIGTDPFPNLKLGEHPVGQPPLQETEDNWVTLHHDVVSKTTINLDDSGNVIGHSYPHFMSIAGAPGSDEQARNAHKHAQFLLSEIEKRKESMIHDGEDPYSTHFPSAYFQDASFYRRFSSFRTSTRRRTSSCPPLTKEGLSTECQPDRGLIPSFKPELEKKFDAAVTVMNHRQWKFEKGKDRRPYKQPIIYGGQKSFAPVFKGTTLKEALPEADVPSVPMPSQFHGHDPPISFVSAGKAEIS